MRTSFIDRVTHPGSSQKEAPVHIRESIAGELHTFGDTVLRPALRDLRTQILQDVHEEFARQATQHSVRPSKGSRIMGARRSELSSEILLEGANDEHQPESEHRNSVRDIGFKVGVGVNKSELLRALGEEEPLLAVAPTEVSRIPEEREAGDDNLPDAETRLDLSGKVHYVLGSVVTHSSFDYFVSLFVLINAALIGCETDWKATHFDADNPRIFFALDGACGLFFTCELSLRMFVHGSKFWSSPDYAWNLFDTVVVGLQIFDGIAGLLPKGMMPDNPGFVHGLRLIRLARIVRLARVLHLLVELRTMLMSIIGSLRSLFWALVLYFMFIFVVSVYFTQTITEQRESAHADGRQSEGFEDLDSYYGSLWRTIFSMWSCILGGMDWAILAKLLMQEVSLSTGVVFIFFVAFCMMAMANVITGIFVETAMQHAEQDADIHVAKKVSEMFRQFSPHGAMSEEAFLRLAKNFKLDELFRAINVDKSDAATVFTLIDADNSGSLDTFELLDGWLRLRGSAKSIDLAVLMREADAINVALDGMQEQLNSVYSAVCGERDEAEKASTTDQEQDGAGKEKTPQRSMIKKSSFAGKALLKRIENLD